MDDQELKDVCTRIYTKHKKALDIIFKHCYVGNAGYNVAIRAALDELSKEGIIIYENQNKTWFYLEEVNNIIPPMSNCNSSYGTNSSYVCWVEIYDETRLVVHFELGGQNLSDEQTAIHQKIIENGNSKYKKEEYKYKRVEKCQAIIEDDGDSFDRIKDLVKKTVMKLKEKVINLLKKCELL